MVIIQTHSLTHIFSLGHLCLPLPDMQSFWDNPGLQADRALIENSFVEPSQKARFLASLASHSGDWLLALPIANCGLRLDEEAVRVAVGMRLGLSLCVPHSCPCGEHVDAQGLHVTVCKKAPGRIATRQTPSLEVERYHLEVYGFCWNTSYQGTFRIAQARR